MCLALGHKSIGETYALSSAEWAFWGEFYRKYGFPTDRVEAGVAIAGAAVCQSNGAKTQPKDLVVRFGGRSAKSAALAWAGIPGAKVERRPKKTEGVADATG